MENAYDKQIKECVERILLLYPAPKDQTLIERAFAVAQKAHQNQARKSGEPYILHPLNAALTIATMRLDAITVAATILHDVIEDTGITAAELENQFGQEILFLVQGVSKLGRLKYRGASLHVENIRKMLVAMAEDIRVILIKFADRLHNMQTLGGLPPNKQTRIALETLEIYAPLAMRLGVSEIAQQFEDLAFPYLYPDEHRNIKEEVAKKYPAREQILQRIKPLIFQELNKEKIVPIEIRTRNKTLYSLWRKLQRYQNNWNIISDLSAARIIVKDIEQCYAALGVIHKLWKPLPGRIKDYIALPKPNGYQSLHTTVFCLDGVPIEFQIRTPQMHDHAEYGIAAHWAYTEKGKPKSGSSAADSKLAWVQQIREWQKETPESEEFWEGLKIDLFKDRIFAFTPKGDVFDLPDGATPVDFAYTVHSALGDECGGAKVNGKMVPLNYELQSGDVVEIDRIKGRTPSAGWLEFVKTSQARAHIRACLKKANREESLVRGLELLDKNLAENQNTSWEKISKEKKMELPALFGQNSLEDLVVAVGNGDVTLRRVIRKLINEEDALPRPQFSPSPKAKDAPAILISGQTGLKIRLAQCCKPLFREPVAAYVTVREGATVHKQNCQHIGPSKKKDESRVFPAHWNTNSQEYAAPVQLEMKAYDRIGLMQDISSAVSNLGINIHSINAVGHAKNEHAVIRLCVGIKSLPELHRVISKLKGIPDVHTIRRK